MTKQAGKTAAEVQSRPSRDAQPSIMVTSKKEIAQMEERVRADLAGMEARLRDVSPGVLDLLRVYGGYEGALRHMDNYLGIHRAEPRFDTSDGTTVIEE